MNGALDTIESPMTRPSAAHLPRVDRLDNGRLSLYLAIGGVAVCFTLSENEYLQIADHMVSEAVRLRIGERVESE